MAKDTRISIDDVRVPPSEYWTKRFTDISDRNGKLGDSYTKDITKLFKATNKEMNAKIASFYSNYGSVKESPIFTTLPDGSRVLSGTTKKTIVTPLDANKRLAKGTRLTKLQSQLNDILKNMSLDQNEIMKLGLSDTATNMFADTIYETYKGIGYGQSFNVLSESQVLSLIRNEVNGQSFSTRVWNNRDKLADTVNQTIKTGITQGLSNREMAKRIAENMGSGTKVANRLLRTEVTNSMAQASLIGYERSGIVTQYQYLATLDNRTSDICTALDLEIFDTKDAITGLNFPPMHVNCRSTTTAYFDDTAITRIARDADSNRTYTVPADMNARDFKSIYIDKSITRKQWDNGKRV